MRRRISSRLNPWGEIAIILLYVPAFLYAGVASLGKEHLAGVVFLLIGLVMLLGFAVFPRPKYAEFDEDFLYVRGLFAKEAVPLSNVKGLKPFGSGKGAFWIEFKTDTAFGRRIFVTFPMREIWRSFPIPKRFNELECVRELLKMVSHETLAPR